jgi:hypothetical protein
MGAMSQDTSPLPTASLTTYRFTRGTRCSATEFAFLGAAFVGCFLLVISPSTFAFADEQQATEKSANGNTDRVVRKLIPDFKFLKGSPATVIDLAELVAD